MVIAPFNFNATQTFQGNGAASAHTVSTDYHAELSVTLAATAEHSWSRYNVGDSTFAGYSIVDSKVVTQKFWLSDGDIITFSATADDENNATTSTNRTDEMIVSLLINGSVAMKIRAAVTTRNVNGSTDLRYKIFSDISWSVAEFLHS